MQSMSRVHLAQHLHDLLLQEMGEDIDPALLLGPPEYARAVLSLCRTCGSPELARIGEQFARASEHDDRTERSRHVAKQAGTDTPGPSASWFRVGRAW